MKILAEGVMVGQAGAGVANDFDDAGFQLSLRLEENKAKLKPGVVETFVQPLYEANDRTKGEN